MDLTFDILQAIGLGIAFGLRPVLAPLVVAICAAANFGVDFEGTPLEFLESRAALLVLTLVAIAGIVQELGRARGGRGVDDRAWLVVALIFGGLFGAGSVADHGGEWWIGAIVGVLSALFGHLALATVVAGARQRLAGEREASIILPAVVEAVAVVSAVLSLVFPPLAVIAALAALVMLIRGRRNASGRHAGLRTLAK